MEWNPNVQEIFGNLCKLNSYLKSNTKKQTYQSNLQKIKDRRKIVEDIRKEFNVKPLSSQSSNDQDAITR